LGTQTPISVFMIGPAKGSHVPPSGSAVQSPCVQQVVEQSLGLFAFRGSVGTQTPLWQSLVCVHDAPSAPLPAMADRGAQTLIPVVASKS
jgi:hypothetical protein